MQMILKTCLIIVLLTKKTIQGCDLTDKQQKNFLTKSKLSVIKAIKKLAPNKLDLCSFKNRGDYPFITDNKLKCDGKKIEMSFNLIIQSEKNPEESENQNSEEIFGKEVVFPSGDLTFEAANGKNENIFTGNTQFEESIKEFLNKLPQKTENKEEVEKNENYKVLKDFQEYSKYANDEKRLLETQFPELKNISYDIKIKGRHLFTLYLNEEKFFYENEDEKDFMVNFEKMGGDCNSFSVKDLNDPKIENCIKNEVQNRILI